MTPESEARIIKLLEQLVAASQPQAALMRPGEVAHEMGISVRTLQRRRQLGQVPAPITIGGQIRWRRIELEQFLHAR